MMCSMMVLIIDDVYDADDFNDDGVDDDVDGVDDVDADYVCGCYVDDDDDVDDVDYVDDIVHDDAGDDYDGDYDDTTAVYYMYGVDDVGDGDTSCVTDVDVVYDDMMLVMLTVLMV